MLKKVRAKVSHGKIELLEDVELPEGKEITIFVDQLFEPKSEEDMAAFERSAGGWEGLLDFDAFLEDLRESRKRQQRPPVDFDT